MSARPRSAASRLTRRFLGVGAVLLLASACWAAGPASVDELELGRLVLLGEEREDEALRRLDALPAANGAAWRNQLVAKGLILAQAGRNAAALATVEQLQALDPLGEGARARAAAALVQGAVFQHGGRYDSAGEAARDALQAYANACLDQPPACLGFERWHAHQLAHLAAVARGALDDALAHARQAQASAAAVNDTVRRLRSELSIAVNLERQGEHVAADKALQTVRLQAQRLADPALIARSLLHAGVIARLRGDEPRALSLLRHSVGEAEAAGLGRVANLARINLVDVERRGGHAKAALATAEATLPSVRAEGNRARERVLLHNMGLAQLALGRTDEGRRNLDLALTLWPASGAERERAAATREYADALAAAGDLKSALGMLRHERRAQAEVMSRAREAALAALQSQFQRQEQEREIALRRQDNELRDATLANQRLRTWLGALLALVVLLAAGVVALMLRRLHRTQKRLYLQRDALRDQSERDALTGLANRRHFLAQMELAAPGGATEFGGGLALIDVDHFKQVNDQHGHTGGDEVLREIARRLRQEVRGGDLLARWGGEEFLVYLPNSDAEGVRSLARRMLLAVGERAIALESGRSCRVTVSIGHACFPLPPGKVAVGWEQALNLVDMAQYLCKAEGRNQAGGIESIDAHDTAGLNALADDFELGVRQGRVRLTHDPGPAAPTGTVAGPSTEQLA